jgi:hypothetical protein
MLCPDKKELQRKCSAAWDAYGAEIARIADHRAAPSISELVAIVRWPHSACVVSISRRRWN